MPAAQIVE